MGTSKEEIEEAIASLKELNKMSDDSEVFFYDDDDDYYPEESDSEMEEDEFETEDNPWPNAELPHEDFIGLQEDTKNGWKAYWPGVRHKKIDPAQAAADFYLLLGIRDKAFVDHDDFYFPSEEEMKKSGAILGFGESEIRERVKQLTKSIEENPVNRLTRMSDESGTKFTELVNELDTSFREYVHMACGGELRHHAGIGCFPSTRRIAWVKWKYIFEEYGPDALLKMEELFLEFPGSSYGGKKWGDAAKILWLRETGKLGPDSITNKHLFVDRVFTLEHNGGCFLNKLEWANFRQDRDGYSLPYYHMKETVLNAHAHNPTNIDVLYGHASDKVRKIVDDYFALAVKCGFKIQGIWSKSPSSVVVDDDEDTVVKAETEVTGLIDWSDELKSSSSSVKKEIIVPDQPFPNGVTGVEPIVLDTDVDSAFEEYAAAVKAESEVDLLMKDYSLGYKKAIAEAYDKKYAPYTPKDVGFDPEFEKLLEEEEAIEKANKYFPVEDHD